MIFAQNKPPNMIFAQNRAAIPPFVILLWVHHNEVTQGNLDI